MSGDLISHLESPKDQSILLNNHTSLQILHHPNLHRIYEERTLIPHIQQLLLRIPSPNGLLTLFIQHLAPTLVLAIASSSQHVRHHDCCDTHT